MQPGTASSTTRACSLLENKHSQKSSNKPRRGDSSCALQGMNRPKASEPHLSFSGRETRPLHPMNYNKCIRRAGITPMSDKPKIARSTIPAIRRGGYQPPAIPSVRKNRIDRSTNEPDTANRLIHGRAQRPSPTSFAFHLPYKLSRIIKGAALDYKTGSGNSLARTKTCEAFHSSIFARPSSKMTVQICSPRENGTAIYSIIRFVPAVPDTGTAPHLQASIRMRKWNWSDEAPPHRIPAREVHRRCT